MSDYLQIIDLSACDWMIKSSPELNKYIKEKAKVDEAIQNQEINTRHRLRVEPKLKWDTERVIEG
jgi:hypothetical protein